ncbi:efflux RND transporter permease subunit, partial [Spirochaetota bacterium]
MIILIGVISALTVKKELLPGIILGKVTITTIYPGASPEDVELNVTKKIEDILDDITGIEEVSSLSAEGTSLITVDIDSNLGKSETDETIRKIR